MLKYRHSVKDYPKSG